MIFKNIAQFYWFFILIPVIILMFFGYKKRHHQLEQTINSSLWPTVIPHLSYSRRFWKRVMLIIGFIFIIIALLRPQYGVIFEQVERKGHDIFIAIDLSQSMLAQDIKPSRLTHAKREVLGLIDDLKGDRIGLIAFSGDAVVQCPLTSDYSAVKMYLDFIEPNLMPVPGTDIASAIKKARLSFERLSKSNKPILILISDGESFENDPIESAKVAAKKGISIYTIGIGTPKGEPIPQFDNNGKLSGYKKDKNGEIVLSQLDDQTLKEIASVSNARYFNSSLGAFVMDQVYQEISYHEKKRLEDSLLKFHQDRYQWFLAIGLLLLFLEIFLSDRKYITKKAIMDN
tara:strand:+ start:16400 stop:17428 length:1029 start_codon:yes stop_codon:yes gene_type:complete